MLKLRTLGECVIEVGDARIGPDSKVVFALLLFLGLERGKRFTRTALMEMFWPDSPRAKAAHSLRQAIYQCRKLGAGIEASKTDLRLPADQVEHDLDPISEPMSTHQISDVEGRDFLPAYTVDLSEVFTQWLERQRSVSQAKSRRRILAGITEHKTRGDWERIQVAAMELLRLDPLNEEATLALAEANAMRGNKVAALRILDRFAHEVGGSDQIKLPTTVLRRRITEQIIECEKQSTAFIGRSEALEFLSRHLRQTRKGEGGTLLVWGEPGIGKSRLISEFVTATRLQGVEVAKVNCQLADSSRPFSAFMELVPRLLSVRGALGSAPHSLKLLRRLASHATESSTETCDDPVYGDDAGAELRWAILDVLDAVVLETTLMLVIEDVHWLDRSSWEVLCTLSKWCADRRLLVLLTSRLQYATNSPIDGCSNIIRLLLGPLTDDDSRILFRSLEPEWDSMEQSESDWFIAMAEGNPYFLRELARHHADTGKARTIPASLSSCLSDRLRRISPTALRLLQTCSLLGRHSTFERLEHVVQSQTFELVGALEELESLDLVVLEETQLTPKHALLADEAMRLCTPAAKRMLHRRIATILEVEVGEANSASLAWTCADHWMYAGERLRGSRLVRTCANHLISLGLSNEATTLMQRAVNQAVGGDDQIESYRALGSAYMGTRDWSRAIETFETLKDLKASRSAGNPSEHDEDELLLLQSRFYGSTGEDELPGCEELLQPVLRCIRDPRMPSEYRLNAVMRGLMIADNASALAVVDELYSQAVDLIADESLPQTPRLMIQMIYETVRGDATLGAQAALELVSLHRKAGNTAELLKFLQSASVPLRQLNRLDEAKAFVYEAIGLAQERQLWNIYVNNLDSLASIELLRSDATSASKAVALAEARLPQSTSIVSPTSLNRVRTLILIAEKQYGQARATFAPAPREMRYTAHRMRDEVIAIRLLVDALNQSRVDKSLMETLLSSHLQSRSSGRGDITSAGLFAALCASGRSSEAEVLACEYLGEYRRDLYPYPTYLATALVDIGVRLELTPRHHPARS